MDDFDFEESSPSERTALKDIEQAIDNQWQNEEFELSPMKDHMLEFQDNSFGELDQSELEKSLLEVNFPQRLPNIIAYFDQQGPDSNEDTKEQLQVDNKPPLPVETQITEGSQGHGVGVNEVVREIKETEDATAQSALLCNTLLQQSQKENVKIEGKVGDDPVSASPPESISASTVLINEASLLSKITEERQTCENSSQNPTSLRGFLSLNEKNYRPHITSLKIFFSSLCDFNKKSFQNMKLFLYFFETKMRQEIEAMKLLDQCQISPIKTSKNKASQIYIEQKMVLLELKAKFRAKQDKLRIFYDVIKANFERCNGLHLKVKEKREKRQKNIETDIIQSMDRIEGIIEATIRGKNPDIPKDKYYELRFLMSYQKIYLKRIAQFTHKLIAHVINMFSKEETLMCKVITEGLVNYTRAYKQCYSEKREGEVSGSCKNPHNIAPVEEIIQNLRDELCEWLLNNIPKELYNRQKTFDGGDRLEALVGDINTQLQNNIFMETIEMNSEYVLFRCDVLWKDRDDNKQVRVSLVLSSGNYLHMESEEKGDEKIASIKLGDVRLSKKGKEVIVEDKRGLLAGYFLMGRELGRLVFDSVEQIDQFTARVWKIVKK